MRPGDAPDDEMRDFRNPVPPLDAAMAERVLDGTVHQDDVPPNYRDVLRVLAAAAAPAAPAPAAEAAALAAFRSTRRPVDPPRRTSVLSKLLGAKAIAAIVLGTAAVGTAAAAATGTLPDAAQDKAHQIVSAVPGAEAGAAQAAAHTPASGRPALPGAVGLCQAYASGSGGDNGKRMDSAALQQLSDAAGGTDKVTAYCGKITAAANRAAGSAATGDRAALAGACRAWQAANQAGRTPDAGILDKLTTAAGGADAIEAYCAALLGQNSGSAADPPAPATPSATPQGSAPTAPPGEGHDQSTPSHPAPPTPRG